MEEFSEHHGIENKITTGDGYMQVSHIFSDMLYMDIFAFEVPKLVVFPL